ncbi:dihydrofolate reductase [Lysobacter helvus]|uniref:Dihydrofolate reductase n=2 Tax=Lysobacteraceae TaxID=32033 RepID=A0ABM7Q6K6_9GAMM|nr:MULTISPECIES: dihydrofolate reductase family protein [Lysobacter]BCT93007.1 dihydrofolate reductase [Lysobacter caseinilyticus]BCT96159.1 dihydrofolate reductase [Lysobacter helvus]
MRKLVVAAFVSLDGVMQAPGGPDEDTSGGFRYGGWTVPLSDDATNQAIADMFATPFELLLGRRTYDIFASYWPKVKDNYIADLFNKVPKHVATHRPDSLKWKGSVALSGDVVAAVRTLKQQDGDALLTQGSAHLVRQLLAAGLVDELRLQTFPVLLGPGKRLFDDKASASSFKVTSSVTSPGGVLLAHYVRSGEVQTGAFD